MQSIQLADFDVEMLRTRLRTMSDEQLRKFGEAAKYHYAGVRHVQISDFWACMFLDTPPE
jgi:hypothetical protein